MPHLEETAKCPDCGGVAEPEEDATTRWMSCTACGYDFAWQLVSSGDGCQLNIPAATRALLQPGFARGGVVGQSRGPHDDSVPVLLTRGCSIPVGPPASA